MVHVSAEHRKLSEQTEENESFLVMLEEHD